MAAGRDVRRGRSSSLLLRGLDLAPLQLQQPVQVPLQGAHGPGPGGAPGLHVVEGGQLTEVPGVEGRREEVWEGVVGVAAASLPEGGAVLLLDDFRPELQLGGNPRLDQVLGLGRFRVAVGVAFSVDAQASCVLL